MPDACNGDSRSPDVKTRISALESRSIDIFVLGDAIGNGIYVIDRNSVITASNKAYSDITGLWEHEYMGRPIAEVLEHFFYNDVAVAQVALEKKRIASGIGRSKRTDKDLLVTAIPVLDASGEVEEVITVLRDITESVRLQSQLQTSIEKTELYRQELSYYRSLENDAETFIGSGPSMEAIKQTISHVALVDATVLLLGETGVGKEVIAREIHRRSHRRNGPYIKVNCAAIPASLIESELFGYEKGAFTGSSGQRKMGLFEMADGGTLLLDEIGEFPMELQAKLLRVLQEREFTRVGGTANVRCDLRVLASTNRDLAEEVKRGAFRKDLYYRLFVIPIVVPPLRDRVEDIPILASHFMEEFNVSYNARKRLDEGALVALCGYDWPGNVRELQNVIERLSVITQADRITKDDVSMALGRAPRRAPDEDAPPSCSLEDELARMEKRLVEDALLRTGSSHKAARLLGVSQATVVRKARKHGITRW